ncbi:MAG TPA: hypothetical protein VF763_01910 [Candidatus Limnocylindrales bacterium]
MEARDRLTNLGLFGAAVAAWLLVALIVLTRDPTTDSGARFAGAVAMGMAVGLTTAPLFWLAVFARHRRIAYRGDWLRAGRRAAWVAVVTALFVVLRVQGALSLPIAVFVAAMVVFAEATLSVDR